MSSCNYDSRLNSFQKSKYPTRYHKTEINNILDISADSTAAQISQFVSSKISEFIEEQLNFHDDAVKNKIHIEK